ncbi:MAG: hypothetical protein NXY57DRAFT_1043285 [Lentinula lateritia]|nr:MAG: hypothetical protein NXY57DRAFT_1043285 [Lentinula lateritia]
MQAGPFLLIQQLVSIFQCPAPSVQQFRGKESSVAGHGEHPQSRDAAAIMVHSVLCRSISVQTEININDLNLAKSIHEDVLLLATKEIRKITMERDSAMEDRNTLKKELKIIWSSCGEDGLYSQEVPFKILNQMGRHELHNNQSPGSITTDGTAGEDLERHDSGQRDDGEVGINITNELILHISGGQTSSFTHIVTPVSPNEDFDFGSMAHLCHEEEEEA